MRYWWVNQKQTHRQEVSGGYLWSPKRRADNARNQFYDNMKAVAPGDIVFSYWDTAIRAYGLLRSFGYDAPKPTEFGDVGRNWSQIGYRADVQYTRVSNVVAPREAAIWRKVQPLLPAKYSPLHRETGKGLQTVYLAALPNALGELFLRAAGAPGGLLHVRENRAALVASLEERERTTWEQHIVEELAQSPMGKTEREALIRARRGQGAFRNKVSQVERACRVTRVNNGAYLIASHIKPWRHAGNDERLSANNGLMLAPQADFLFDRGFISFGDGKLLVSEVADEESLVKLGVDPERPPEVGGFNDEQEKFLEFHRSEIFRSAERC